MGRDLRSGPKNIGLNVGAPDKVHIFISIMPISSPDPMFHHLSMYRLIKTILTSSQHRIQ